MRRHITYHYTVVWCETDSDVCLIDSLNKMIKQQIIIKAYICRIDNDTKFNLIFFSTRKVKNCVIIALFDNVLAILFTYKKDTCAFKCVKKVHSLLS